MTRALAGLVLAVATLLLAACGACGCSSFDPGTTSPVDGVVIAVDAVSLTNVRGFTIRTSGGDTFDFTLGDLENATDFSPSHLKEHQATSAPIRVWFQVVNGDRVVYRLEDASAPSATTPVRT
jgi:hypothetical protein